MDLPQCWAYNIDSKRCEQRAGHAGNHAYTISWTDDDCYQPGTPAHSVNKTSLPVPVQDMPTIPEPTIPPAGESVPEVGKCAACKHQHRGGTCMCGCYEHIG